MEDYYRVQNLYEASFLLARGFPLAGKEQSGGKITVLFMDSEEIRKEALGYYNGSKVSAKEYSDAYRSLKDFIFQK